MKKSFSDRTARFVLPNGATLLVLENHANPTVSTAGFIKAGDYFNPSGRHGLASTTASMLNKGTARHTKLELAEALESVGARLGISASTFTASVSSQSLSRDLPLIFSILAEELRTPAFPDEELQKLKQRTIASIKQNQEETRSRAFERLTQIIFPSESPFFHPSADEMIGAIETTTVDELRRFYEAHYSPASLLLTVVGDVETERVRGIYEEMFGHWEGAPAPAIELPWATLQEEPRRELVSMKDKANVDVIIGHASLLRRANEDYLAAVLANRALGQSSLSSRLGLRVRDEMGLTYGINSGFLESGIGDGPFMIGVTVAPENVELAIDTTLEIVDEFIRDGIREEELSDEKSSWTGSFKVGLATNSGMASQLAAAELLGLGIGYLDRFPDLLAAISKAEVDAAIRKYIHPEVSTTVIAGTYREA